MRNRPWKLGEHFMLVFICAGVTLVAYLILLYSFEEKVTCIPKHCAESSGVSSNQAPGSIEAPPAWSQDRRSDAWTSEVRTSTDQRDASWIPPLID